MRAVGLALVLLIVAVPGAQAWMLVGQYYSTQPGWNAESFTVDDYEWIRLTYAIASRDEFIGGVIALLDGNDQPLVTIVDGSDGGQIVDVSARASGFEIDNEDQPGVTTGGTLEHTMYFRCSATCDPSRSFTLVTSASGELSAWGYGLFARNGTRTGIVNGTSAWAVPSRDFEGTSILVGHPFGGVAVTDEATYSFHVNDAFYGAWFKPSSARPESMRMDTPAGARACDCLVQGSGAGDYALHYSDVDTSGTESYLIGADVQLP